VNDPNALIARCRALAGIADEMPCDGDAMIGILQQYRPAGEGVYELFDDSPVGQSLAIRLRKLYEIAGDSTRPGGGQDAYFIVRTPRRAEVDEVYGWAVDWLKSLQQIAAQTNYSELHAALAPLPEVRVLEGIAPKQTKADLATSMLYLAIKKLGADLLQRLPADSSWPHLLGPAYYFAACDWALRDYLLWPVYAAHCELHEPFEPYFQLWQHGAKLRCFSDNRLDVYLPHCDN